MRINFAEIKKNFPDLQKLFREKEYLRAHNRENGSSANLLFAEAAITLVTLERFLRLILGVRAKGKTLRTLLLQATDTKSGFLVIEGKEAAIRTVADLRNIILHGDFEAATFGREVPNKFTEKNFLQELDRVHDITDAFFAQAEEKIS